MAVFDLATIKTWFETGDKPTQQQFSDMLDSLVHQSQLASLQGLGDYITSKVYVPGNTVVYNENIYRCAVTTVAGAFETDKWQLITVKEVLNDAYSTEWETDETNSASRAALYEQFNAIYGLFESVSSSFVQDIKFVTSTDTLEINKHNAIVGLSSTSQAFALPAITSENVGKVLIVSLFFNTTGLNVSITGAKKRDNAADTIYLKADNDKAMFVATSNGWYCISRDIFLDLSAKADVTYVDAQLATKVASSGGTLTGALNEAPTVSVASAATTSIFAANSANVDVTGSATITNLGAGTEGTLRFVRFTGGAILTHNATSLQLPNNANIDVLPGDVGIFKSLGGTNAICISFTQKTAIAGNSFLTFNNGRFLNTLLYPSSNGVDVRFDNSAFRLRDTANSSTYVSLSASNPANRITLEGFLGQLYFSLYNYNGIFFNVGAYGNDPTGNTTTVKGRTIIFNSNNGATNVRAGEISLDGMAIGTSAINAACALDIQSGAKGAGMPVLTNSVFSALATREGNVAYNSNKKTLSIDNGISKVDLALKSDIPITYEFAPLNFLVSTVPFQRVNATGALPSTRSAGLGAGSINIDSFRVVQTSILVAATISMTDATVDAVTVGANPTVRIDMYKNLVSSRVLIATLRVPITAIAGIGTSSTPSTLTAADSIFSLSGLSFNLTAGDLIGAEVVPESGSTKICGAYNLKLTLQTILA